VLSEKNLSSAGCTHIQTKKNEFSRLNLNFEKNGVQQAELILFEKTRVEPAQLEILWKIGVQLAQLDLETKFELNRMNPIWG